MAQLNTKRALEDMTDDGKFECLATDILRAADDRCRSLCHPGVNADNKTVRSPVDGICFVPGATPTHMIVVHHTTCSAKDLKKKWLHNPANTKSKTGDKLPTTPKGDLLKTIEIVTQERERSPNLKATLVLTTNREPGEQLVRAVHFAGEAAGIAIDVWACSRLANFLDNEPRGQWLRSQYLGVRQLLLSEELLSELSRKSRELFLLPDPPEAWVKRALDAVIAEAENQDIVFLVAESGSGKSVACYKRLQENLSAGGFGLFLTDEVIASSHSLETAVEKTLGQLHPFLVGDCGSAALRLARPNRQLLLVIEDINRSGRGAILIEKIVQWGRQGAKSDGVASWQVLCPVWPQVMSSLSEQVRKRINVHAIAGSGFTAVEGAEAVKHRSALNGNPVTLLQAARISQALGNDPLLIALQDPAKTLDTTQTIAQFVEAELQKLAAEKCEFSPAEYRLALLILAKTMLLKRLIQPAWTHISSWPELADRLAVLRHIVHQRSLIRLTGPSTNEKLEFRHDRVREWLLAHAAFYLMREKAMPDDIAAEPYFAEILGLALTQWDATPGEISAMAALNPLVLFCAVRHFRAPPSIVQNAVVSELKAWLVQTTGVAQRFRRLRDEAMRVLADAENQSVLSLVAEFHNNSWNALRARFRNGDLMGGIGLCLKLSPGTTMVGHDAYLDHVMTRFGENIIRELKTLLDDMRIDESIRIGALRLAGHIGVSELADAVRSCWHNDNNRHERLDDYLWACAQCIDNDPATLLGPVCDGWAALSNTAEQNGMPSARESLASHEVRWAFHKKLPDRAVRYFIDRASRPELEWPITFLLHGLDHPDAVEFIARQLAAIQEKVEETGGFSPFVMSASDEWERRQEQTGNAMSEPSRKRLREMWQDLSAGKHLRTQSFAIWVSTVRTYDIEVMRTISSNDALYDRAVFQRLRRGDLDAIPALVEKLAGVKSGYWWQSGRHIWSSELTTALDDALNGRKRAGTAVGEDAEESLWPDDWILSEMVTRLPTGDAHTLLVRHWDKLQTSRYFVSAALYVATKELQERAAAAIKLASDPKDLLGHLSSRFGYKTNGHPGLVRLGSLEAIVPYIDFLDEFTISNFWDACNEKGWFDFRRAHLDTRLPPSSRDWAFLDEPRTIKALDVLLAEKSPWIEHWLDEFLKTGVSIDDVMATLGRWLSGKSQIEALRMASRAILHIGERRHLDLLRQSQVEHSEAAYAIIVDAEFGVRRRTL